MSCTKCGLNKPIKNKFHKLCLECNNERLYGSKYGKQYNNTLSNKTSFKSSKKKGKSNKSLFAPVKKTKVSEKLEFNNIKEGEEKVHMIVQDEIFYEKCFNTFYHKCEECSQPQPTEFRNEEGKVIARYRYSHIIPKSIAPELRHDINNINDLCVSCHGEWENGEQKKMRIYEKNSKKFPNYFD